LWVIVFVVTGFVALGGLSWLRGGGKELVPWRSDWEAARAEAVRERKPVFVYFTAEWCGPCQQLRRTTWSDRRVAEALGTAYVPVRIDIDRQPGLAREYNVEAIPWFAVLDEQGRPVRAWSGWVDADDFLKWLKG
jgi:thioredoxin-like negative regulator of GroEL